VQANIHRVLNLILALFLLVALWLGYWGVVRAPELSAREDTPRRVEAERRLQRGRVLDRDGAPLAWSEVDDDGHVERRYAGDWLAHVVGYYSLRHGVGGVEAARDAYLRGEANRTGAIVLLDAQRGQVLALVSHPSFDPNRLDEDWEALREAPGRPLFNRATQGLYPPGATLNLVIMAAALEEGLTRADEVFRDKYGRAEVGGTAVRCTSHPGLVALDLLQAAAYGCNVAFAELSLRLGSDRLADYANRLGIDRAPDLEIPTAAGQIARRLPLAPEILASTGFGQGETLVSPLQMALLAAAVADDGEMPRPTLLLGQTEPARPVISPETARLIRQAMTLAVSEGAARQAGVPGVTVAGKVGTAEGGGEALPHAWFVGFAPAGAKDVPRFAISVVVEHGGQGGQAAAPIAARLLELALATP
jgi:peptidoglycan glycosyltransferase